MFDMSAVNYIDNQPAAYAPFYEVAADHRGFVCDGPFNITCRIYRIADVDYLVPLTATTPSKLATEVKRITSRNGCAIGGLVNRRDIIEHEGALNGATLAALINMIMERREHLQVEAA